MTRNYQYEENSKRYYYYETNGVAVTNISDYTDGYYYPNYGRKEIQVMNLRPSKNKPGVGYGWIEYAKFVNLQHKLNTVITLSAVALALVVSIFCFAIIKQHDLNESILESYDLEYQRSVEKDKQIEADKETIKNLQNQVTTLEYQNKAYNESLSDNTGIINALTVELSAANEYIESAISAPSTKEYTQYTDLGVTEAITVERMDRIINFWIARNGATDSPFIGRGNAFIKASQESGLDPIFIFAISAHESDFGRTRIARDKFNYMGIGAYDSTPYDSANHLSDNVEDGIVVGAKWIADRYYNKGQKTLHDMIYGPKQYSTSQDSWINGINSIMRVSATIE